ncbi:hypothetical protein BDV38DRAFT_281948 [Aspergillus pseudotamarii]|uniref:Uncharacterized protein n=1 Tax=Aspergillus pseudotamarii TaxID=132259 RepID=A0A5N6SVD9_ASPPS|nr:uncharacterized protein BDV38DRAFT_281948 [Aspergillus pseudotamarii]KAE8138648.1 hypothetical protein BDV38DRAFT_281948 [Aspergillus pseudotamarii]
MPDPLWDPDLILQVTKGGRQGMFCLGQARSRYNSRCRWDVEKSEYSRIRSMLKGMSKRLPHTINYDELSTMASLGLCDYHAGQEAEIVDGWLRILANIEHLNSQYQCSSQTNEEALEAMAMDIQKCRELIHCDPDSEEIFSVALARYVRRQRRMKKDLEECRTTLASLQKTAVDTDCLEKENSELSTEVSYLSQRLATAEQVIEGKDSEQQAKIHELRKERDALRAENMDRSVEIECLHGQKDLLDQRLRDRTNELDSACLVSRGLTKERDDLKSELETTKDEITELKESKSALLTESNVISTTLARTRPQLTASHQANEHLSKELETAKVQLAKLHDILRAIDIAKKASFFYKLRAWAQQFWHRVTGWSRSRRVPISDEEEGLTLASVEGSHAHGG